MDADRTESDEALAPPAAKSNLAVILALSILLGVLLTGGALGGYFYIQGSNAFDAKVLAMETSLQEKSQTIAGLQRQIEALSGQMHLLRDYAIARSTELSEQKERTKKTEPLATSPKAAPSAESAAGSKPSVVPTSPLTPGASHVQAGKAQPEEAKAENCELVGKSPEEQVETLRRCVALMDSSSSETAPRSR